MDKAQISSQMETFIQVNIKMGNLMEKDSIRGKMVHFILVILKMDLNMVRAGGRVAKDPNVINMKVIIAKIKNMGMVFSHGQVEIFIKESIKKTREMAMVK